MKKPVTRKTWTQREDNAICILVEELGSHRWSTLSVQMKERFGISRRSGKQCRERWHNHLDPRIDKKPWTSREEVTLFELQAKFGNCWAEISKHLPGRTDNSVKNHFYCTIRKKFRQLNKGKKNPKKSKTIHQALSDPLVYKEIFKPCLGGDDGVCPKGHLTDASFMGLFEGVNLLLHLMEDAKRCSNLWCN